MDHDAATREVFRTSGPACFLTSITTMIAHDRVAEADAHHALDCIECGSCSFICPAEIPLVQSIRLAKGRVMDHRRRASA